MIQKILQYKIAAAVIYFLLWISFLFLQATDIETDLKEILYWTVNAVIFLVWLLVLIDIINAKINRKIFWIASMFLLPFFAPVFYLFQKNSLLRLKSNKFRNK